MTREEAIKYLIQPIVSSTDIGKEKQKELDAYNMAIKALEQEQKWIPVSKRLPNLDEFIGEYIWQKKVLITCYLSFDNTKNLFVTEAFAKDVVYNSIHDTVVTAWMPLPKPYELQERNDKE